MLLTKLFGRTRMSRSMRRRSKRSSMLLIELGICKISICNKHRKNRKIEKQRFYKNSMKLTKSSKDLKMTIRISILGLREWLRNGTTMERISNPFLKNL